jgi:hypothetical protein
LPIPAQVCRWRPELDPSLDLLAVKQWQHRLLLQKGTRWGTLNFTFELDESDNDN